MQQVDRQAVKRRKESTCMQLGVKQKMWELLQKRGHLLAIVGVLVLLFAIVNPLAAPAQVVRRPVAHPKVKPTVVPTPTPPDPPRQIPVLTLRTTADSGDWTSYLGNPRQGGDNTAENLIDATTASKLKL